MAVPRFAFKDGRLVLIESNIREGDFVSILHGEHFAPPIAGSTGTVAEIRPRYFPAEEGCEGQHGYRVVLTEPVDDISFVTARPNEIKVLNSAGDIALGSPVLISHKSGAEHRRGMLGVVTKLVNQGAGGYDVTFVDLSKTRFFHSEVDELILMPVPEESRLMFNEMMDRLRYIKSDLIRDLLMETDGRL